MAVKREVRMRACVCLVCVYRDELVRQASPPPTPTPTEKEAKVPGNWSNRYKFQMYKIL